MAVMESERARDRRLADFFAGRRRGVEKPPTLPGAKDMNAEIRKQINDSRSRVDIFGRAKPEEDTSDGEA